MSASGVLTYGDILVQLCSLVETVRTKTMTKHFWDPLCLSFSASGRVLERVCE